MSFILDALQKSERERQAGQAPALDEALHRPPPAPRSRHRHSEAALMLRTGLAVSAVFLIAGLLWWLLSRSGAEDGAVPPPPVLAAEPPSAPAPEPSPALRVDPERLASPALAARPEPEAPAADSLDELLDDVPPEPEPAEAPAPAPPPAPVVAAPVAPPALMPLKDMPPSFRAEFPALSVQVHFHDANPLRRFVLVNGRKYRETDNLVEGPRVVEIVPEGIILDLRGTRVLLEIAR